MKKVILIGICLLMLFSAVACNMYIVDQQKDAAQVAATVNGIVITKGQVTEMLDIYKSIYGITPATEKTTEGKAQIAELTQNILDYLIENEVAVQQFDKAGLILSAEDIVDVDKQIEDAKESMSSAARNEVEGRLAAEPNIDVEAEVAKLVKERGDANGMNDGTYREEQIKYSKMQKLEDSIGADYAPSEQELNAELDKKVEEQKTKLDIYITEFDGIESSGDVYYYPEGVRYVKNLLIAIPEEIRNEISDLRANGDDAGADKLRDEQLALIKDSADVYYAELEDGESFDEVMAEHTEDPGMRSEPTMSKGYAVYPGKTGFDTNFLDAALALKDVGDYSKPTASDFGYFIIELSSIPTPGAVALDTVREKLTEELISAHKTDALAKAKEEWKAAAEIVKVEGVF